MASRTKGITIEINGDATKLDESLKDVNKSLGEASRGLQDVNRLLKLDPSNTELLSQKQDYLKRSIEGTKEKLDREKEALEQLKNSDGFDASSEQAKALERQIVADEEALKRFKEEVKKLPTPFQASMQEAGKKVSEVGEKIQGVGGKVTEAGKTLTAGVTAPIAGVAAASVAAWTEVDEAMDTVTKKTGASGDALADMQQRAKNLAGSIPTDFQTAADAVGEVNTRFGATGDQLEDLSGKFIKFAELNDTDVSSSIDSVQAAMAAWGLETDQAGDVLDVLNKAGQDTGVNVDKLSNLLKTNKTYMDEAGLSFSDSAMFLANLDKNGIDAGVAMTGLRKALQNATKDGKTSKQALDELQAVMGDGSNKAEAYATATELFGSKAGPAIADACMEGRLSFDELGTSMGDFAGNVENTFNETLDPLDQMQMSMNEMKTLGADIVDTAAPMITEAMKAIRDAITKLKEKWDGLDDNQKQTILKIAGIAAAVGPVLVILGTVINVVGGIILTIGNVITILGAPLLLPIAAVVAAVAGAIAFGVLLIKNWDKIKESAGKFVKDVGDKWDSFKENTKQKFEDTKAAAVQKVQDLKDGAVQKVQDLKDGAVQKVQDLKDEAEQKFHDLKDAAVQKVQDLKDGALQKVQDLRDGFNEKVEGIAGKAKETFDALKGFIEDPVGSAKDFVKNAVEDIKGFFNFDWKLPELKLPHITIGGYIDVPVFGTIPDPNQIYVDWYDKAMNFPRILKKATIFGAAGGKLLGGGESGEEVVSGKETLLQMIKNAVASVMQKVQMFAQAPAGETIQSALQAVAGAAQKAGDSIRNYRYGSININVYGAEGQDINQLAQIIKDDIRSEMDREEAVFA